MRRDLSPSYAEIYITAQALGNTETCDYSGETTALDKRRLSELVHRQCTGASMRFRPFTYSYTHAAE